MSAVVICLFVLVNLLNNGQTRQVKAKYEAIKEFELELEKEWHKKSHLVIRRAAPTNSANRTSKPYNHTTPPPVTHFSTTINGYSNNISSNEDNHKYYKSRYDTSGIKRWWFNLDSDGGTPKFHKNSQYADTVPITFQFPYYGHVIKSITVTNKGFLFVGEQVHKFNASAQYIAPLMAGFDAESHNDTKIRYIDTGDRFTTEWINIRLRNQSVGAFSFQCSIFNDGRIVFAYKNVPVPVSDIKNDTFYVRVGFSDSFDLHRILRGHFFIKGKYYNGLHYVVYYLYHKVQLDRKNVRNGTAFVITPLPNCVLYKTCDSCIQSKTAFSCAWCPNLKRCSDGVDRYRHDWLVFGCHENSVTTCPVRSTPTNKSPTPTSTSEGENEVHSSDHKGHGPRAVGIVILILVCVAICLGIVGWIVYAYRNPQSSSGMFLLRYGNPRRWCRKSSGETESRIGGTVAFKSMSNESNA